MVLTELQRLLKSQEPTSLLSQNGVILKKSLLFDSREIKSITKDMIYTIGRKGFEDLLSIDCNFACFSDSLFGTESKELSIRSADNETVAKYSKEVESFLMLASPYLMVQPMLYCIEWLLSNFNISENNWCCLINSVLLHHDVKLFSRIIQLIDFESNKGIYSFFKISSETLLPLSKRSLIAHIQRTPELLLGVINFINKLTHEIKERGFDYLRYDSTYSFYSSIMYSCLNSAIIDSNKNLHIRNQIIYNVVNSVASKVESLRAAHSIVLIKLIQGTSLHQDQISFILRRLIQNHGLDKINAHLFAYISVHQSFVIDHKLWKKILSCDEVCELWKNLDPNDEVSSLGILVCESLKNLVSHKPKKRKLNSQNLLGFINFWDSNKDIFSRIINELINLFLSNENISIFCEILQSLKKKLVIEMIVSKLIECEGDENHKLYGLLSKCYYDENSGSDKSLNMLLALCSHSNNDGLRKEMIHKLKKFFNNETFVTENVDNMKSAKEILNLLIFQSSPSIVLIALNEFQNIAVFDLIYKSDEKAQICKHIIQKFLKSPKEWVAVLGSIKTFSTGKDKKNRKRKNDDDNVLSKSKKNVTLFFSIISGLIVIIKNYDVSCVSFLVDCSKNLLPESFSSLLSTISDSIMTKKGSKINTLLKTVVQILQESYSDLSSILFNYLIELDTCKSAEGYSMLNKSCILCCFNWMGENTSDLKYGIFLLEQLECLNLNESLIKGFDSVFNSSQKYICDNIDSIEYAQLLLWSLNSFLINQKLSLNFQNMEYFDCLKRILLYLFSLCQIYSSSSVHSMITSFYENTIIFENVHVSTFLRFCLFLNYNVLTIDHLLPMLISFLKLNRGVVDQHAFAVGVLVLSHESKNLKTYAAEKMICNYKETGFEATIYSSVLSEFLSMYGSNIMNCKVEQQFIQLFCEFGSKNKDNKNACVIFDACYHVLLEVLNCENFLGNYLNVLAQIITYLDFNPSYTVKLISKIVQKLVEYENNNVTICNSNKKLLSILSFTFKRNMDISFIDEEIMSVFISWSLSKNYNGNLLSNLDEQFYDNLTKDCGLKIAKMWIQYLFEHEFTENEISLLSETTDHMSQILRSLRKISFDASLMLPYINNNFGILYEVLNCENKICNVECILEELFIKLEIFITKLDTYNVRLVLSICERIIGKLDVLKNEDFVKVDVLIQLVSSGVFQSAESSVFNIQYLAIQILKYLGHLIPNILSGHIIPLYIGVTKIGNTVYVGVVEEMITTVIAHHLFTVCNNNNHSVSYDILERILIEFVDALVNIPQNFHFQVLHCILCVINRYAFSKELVSTSKTSKKELKKPIEETCAYLLMYLIRHHDNTKLCYDLAFSLEFEDQIFVLTSIYESILKLQKKQKSSNEFFKLIFGKVKLIETAVEQLIVFASNFTKSNLFLNHSKHVSFEYESSIVEILLSKVLHSTIFLPELCKNGRHMTKMSDSIFTDVLNILPTKSKLECLCSLLSTQSSDVTLVKRKIVEAVITLASDNNLEIQNSPDCRLIVKKIMNKLKETIDARTTRRQEKEGDSFSVLKSDIYCIKCILQHIYSGKNVAIDEAYFLGLFNCIFLLYSRNKIPSSMLITLNLSIAEFVHLLGVNLLQYLDSILNHIFVVMRKQSFLLLSKSTANIEEFQQRSVYGDMVLVDEAPTINANKSHIYFEANVTALMKVFNTLPMFFSSHLVNTVSELISNTSIMLYVHKDQEDLANNIELITKNFLHEVCRNTSLRVYLPKFDDIITKLLDTKSLFLLSWNTKFILSILDFFTTNLSTSELTDRSDTFLKFFCTLFDICFSNEDSYELKDSISNSFYIFLLKHSETQCYPIFQSFYTWNTNKNRNYAFFYIINEMWTKLKSIMLLFVPIYFEHAVSCLKNANTDDFDMQEFQVTNLVIDSFKKCFNYDRSGYMNKQKLDVIIKPLIGVIKFSKFNVDQTNHFILYRLAPTFEGLAQCIKDSSLNTTIHKKLLKFIKKQSKHVLYSALIVLGAFYKSLGPSCVTLLPDAAPVLTEILEDENSLVENQARSLIHSLEAISGESMDRFF